jgi:chromosome segregation ATPase
MRFGLMTAAALLMSAAWMGTRPVNGQQPACTTEIEQMDRAFADVQTARVALDNVQASMQGSSSQAELERAQADVQQAEAELRDTQSATRPVNIEAMAEYEGNLSAAKQRVDGARRRLEEIQARRPAGASQAALDQARGTLDAARAALEVRVSEFLLCARRT